MFKKTTLYIHIPFCEKKCFYCSFVVSIGQQKRMDDYLFCLAREAEQYKDQSIKSVYIGGGTPTFLNIQQLEKLFNVIRSNFKVDSLAEWTIEANPEGLDKAKIKLLQESGINRISLGVQSMNDSYLRYLGRNHNSKKVLEVYGWVRAGGFKNVNIDLMFCFPNQTIAQLKEDIDAIIRLNSEHVSLYALTVEKNSRFFVQNIQLPDDQVQAEHYQLVMQSMAQAGLAQYEVSNFAKPGYESAHNYHYWQGGEYIGLGIGAHSYLNHKRSWNITRLTEYLRLIEEGKSVVEGFEQISSSEQFNEAVLFGLRMNKGINLKALELEYGCQLKEEHQQLIDVLIEEKLLKREGSNLSATDKGRMVLDEISVRLI